MPSNVLLIVMDSVRARNTGLHGHYNQTTPFLEELCQETATKYHQAKAPGARSITSHACLFTGLDVEEHGVLSADHRLKENSTVWETLQDEGYSTGVFSENVWITEVDVGLSRGFDRVVGPQDIPYPEAINPRRFVAEKGRGEYREFLNKAWESEQKFKSIANGIFTKVSSEYANILPDSMDASSPGNLFRDRFLEWLDTVNGAWAGCINLMDAHSPYMPKEDHNKWGDDELLSLEEKTMNKWQLASEPTGWWTREARESIYDGAIHQTDSYVEDIIDGLKQRGEYEDTLIVVTSDHGEGFGEPSRIRPTRVAGHNVSVHEVVLHVPLVVKYPGQTEGREVEELAEIKRFPDAVATVLDGETPGDEVFQPDGYGVASTFGITRDDQLRSRAERFCDDHSNFDGVCRVVYEDADDGGVRKYVTWKSNEVTVKVRDAQTSYKMGDGGREKVDEVFDEVTDVGVREESGGMDVDDETYDRLEELGYV
ncbi:MAG: sulfatase-like hydrolase/transferase [Halobacteria archaeon]